MVLLDIYLPDMEGFEVAKALGRNGNPAAVILTSSRDSSDFGPLVERIDREVRARILRKTEAPLVVPAQLEVEPGLVGAAILGGLK